VESIKLMMPSNPGTGAAPNVYTYKGCVKYDGLPFGPGVFTQFTNVRYEGELNSAGLFIGKVIWTSANRNVKYIYVFENGNYKSEQSL